MERVVLLVPKGKATAPYTNEVCSCIQSGEEF